MRDEKHRYLYTTPQELIKALRSLVKKDPNVRLVKNRVGNLSIVKPVDDDRIYEYLGYVDLHENEVSYRSHEEIMPTDMNAAELDASRKVESKPASQNEIEGEGEGADT